MKDWAEMNKRQIKELSENFIENLRYMKNEYTKFRAFAERVNEKKELFFKEFDEFYNKNLNFDNKKKSWSIPEKIEKFNEIDFTKLSTMNTQNLVEAKNFYSKSVNFVKLFKNIIIFIIILDKEKSEF